MLTDQLDKKGHEYDSDHNDGPERSYSAPSANDNDLPSGHPSRGDNAHKPKDGDQLNNDENNVADNKPGASPLGGELGKLGKGFTGGGGAVGAITNATPAGRLAKTLLAVKSNKGKSAGITGIVVTLVISGLGFFSAGLEAINVKENYSNLGSLSSNYSLKNRNARSMAKITQAFVRPSLRSVNATGALTNLDTVNSAKYIARMKKAGFTFDLDPTDNTVKSMSKELKNGTTKTIDYAGKATAETISKDAADMIRAGGSEVIGAIEKANSSLSSRWLGPASRSMMKNRLQSTLESAINKIKPDPTKTEPENQVRAATELSTPEADIKPEVSTTGVDPVTEDAKTGVKTDADGNIVLQETDVNAALDNAGGSVDNATSTAVADSLDNIVAGAGVEATATGLKEISAKLATSTASSFAMSAVNYSQGIQVACSAIGTIQFISNVRNVLFTVELARFALRYLNAADSQKAGIVTGGGLSLMLKFMHTGKGSYTSAPGLLFAMGNKSHRVSESSRTRFSGGRESAGNFGKLDSFISNTTGLNGDARKKTCKTVNNGWFQLGAIVVSVGITALTIGGGAGFSVSANALIIGGIQAAASIALAIGGPMLAQAGKHLIIADLKDSFQKGDGLGAGLGALRSMNESSNSLLITPKTLSAALRVAALEDYKQTMKSESIFNRYFSATNGKSLTAQLAMVLPSKAQGISNGSFFTNNNPLSMDTVVSGLGQVMGGNTYATNDQCTDPAMADYETDPFCFSENSIAPDLDIQQTYDLMLANGDIDSQGQPVSDTYKLFIDRCASGQPTLVYNTNVKKDGSDDSINTTCTKDEFVLKGETTPTTQAYAYIYENQPKQSLFARLIGQKTYAAPQNVSLVGARQRYAAWSGFMVDKSNLIDNITESSPPSEYAKVGNGPNVVFGNTSDVPCGAGEDLGPVDGYKNGSLYKIRLCKITDTIRVNSQISKSIFDMLNASKSIGLTISATDSYRTMAVQRAGFHERCGANYPETQSFQKPPCVGAPIARPGYSNHQMGLALDITCNGTGVGQSYASASTNPCFKWMQANAAQYGLYEYGKGKPTSRASTNYEGWHWSADGN